MIVIWVGPAQAQESPKAARDQEANKTNDIYLVGSGDILNIVIWKNEDLTDDYIVRPDGKTTLPLIGDIVAEGMSTDAIAMQIERKLELFIEDPFITVIVKSAVSNRIYILGEVVQPGVYPLPGRMNVLQALALAGGFTGFAKKDRMVLIRQERDKQTKFDISYKEILRDPKTGFNILLERGDTLVVP
jgi:polysaccharide export outer membrane protein